MRGLLALSAAVFCLSARAQVTVNESATRAHLVDGTTTITLALKNAFSRPLHARVTMKWLSPDDWDQGQANQRIEVAPGESTVEIALSLKQVKNALKERLLYEVVPDYFNLTAFDPVRGALSFPNIADYAFTLRLVVAGAPRVGELYEVRALTTHPITGQPVAGVAVQMGDATATSGQSGMAVLRVVTDEDESLSLAEADAKLGDFEQSAHLNYLPEARSHVQIQCDKPIYQPGQTVHLRMLAFGTDGKAAVGVEHELKIRNQNEDLEYAVKLKTSAYGIASTDWEIPASAKSGDYETTIENEDEGTVAAREISVRRYELPSFKVLARAGRSYYLPHQQATLEVRADYLFGKPLKRGQVRITEGNDEDADDFAVGPLKADGSFRTSFNIDTEIPKTAEFVDRHFTAFVTDDSDNRTEQKKFDLRVSRAALHIYISNQTSTPEGRRVYVTTFSPDGAAVKAAVQLFANKKMVAQGRSNRFGIVRLDLGDTEGHALIRARTDDGRQAEQAWTLAESGEKELWLDTRRAIYRPGEAVNCELRAKRNNVTVQVMAVNRRGRIVFSQEVRLTNRRATLTIPYAESFGRELEIAAIAGPMQTMASANVIFPREADLKIRSTTEKETYLPGATARLHFEASAQAALGIAIVDQSVLERNSTEAAFGQRSWFYENNIEPRVGDVSYSDLLNMDASKIDAEVELLAEVLLENLPSVLIPSDDFGGTVESDYQSASEKRLAPFRQKLDEIYLNTLTYPRDKLSYFQIGEATQHDPWLQPYRVRFSAEGPDDVMELCSSGPDKTPNTDDDFCVWEARRKWFARWAASMADALRPLEDYPATTSAALQTFENAGIHFNALRDPWRNAMRLEVSAKRDRRVLEIRSAGPDGIFDTDDDVLVCSFSGTYFGAQGRKIQKKIEASARFPKSDSELRELARAAGVDLEKTRDPWGHRYFAAQYAKQTYYDKVSFYTYAEYGHVEETRRALTPARRETLIMDLRSAGPDGVRGTDDDFPVYMFFRILAPAAKSGLGMTNAKLPTVPGNGVIIGTISDQSGAAVAGAKVSLNDLYISQTDTLGKYIFVGVPRGIYRLSFESNGFQKGILRDVPVEGDNVTGCDFVLQVGSTQQTVEVKAAPSEVQTDSATHQSSALSTPRLREYFPETLFWLPELITDSAGRATVDVKLADTITQWHVAVMASTIDGRVSETESQITAFQPFQAALDMPPVLTVGDRLTLPVPIRNYSAQSQEVTIKAAAESGLRAATEVGQAITIAKGATSHALLDLQAISQTDKARLQLSAVGGTASDAVAKSTLIHADGERFEKSITQILGAERPLQIDVPAAALAGSVRAEVKLYPTLLARLLETVQALLERPYGCGEQTISASYPNLLVLQAMKRAGMQDKKLEERARKNLRIGYERLLGYQSEEGGFKYWAKSEPDVALTAYALHFLRDLREFSEVDEDRIQRAANWLQKQRQSSAPERFPWMMDEGTVTLERLTRLAKKAAAFEDPYEMAAFASAAIDAQKPEIAEATIRRLTQMAQDEQGAAYWAMRANTPFHGWGRSGQVETTAMVLMAFAKWQKLPLASRTLDLAPLIDRGVFFLLKNSGRDGAWGSGQATVRALMALFETAGKMDNAERTVEVVVNGATARTLTVSGGRTLAGPYVLDVSALTRPGKNEVTLRSADGKPMETQFNAVWYERWSQPHKNQDFSMQTSFSELSGGVNEAVTCQVQILRPQFRGYGMLIAEVGLPPGVEVDRGSLESALRQVDSYEVAPDHVTFYAWPKASGLKFSFQFRPRYAIAAKMAESVLYDYYNPDARAVLVPEKFSAQVPLKR